MEKLEFKSTREGVVGAAFTRPWFTVKLLYEGYQVHRYLRLYKISGLRLHLWRDSIVAIPLEQLVTGRLGNKQPRPEGWRINHDPMLSDIIEHHDLRN